MGQQEARYVVIGDFARRLSVTPTTVRRWEREGRIPASLRLEGGSWRIWPLSDVEQAVAELAELRAKETAVA